MYCLNNTAFLFTVLCCSNQVEKSVTILYNGMQPHQILTMTTSIPRSECWTTSSGKWWWLWSLNSNYNINRRFYKIKTQMSPPVGVFYRLGGNFHISSVVTSSSRPLPQSTIASSYDPFQTKAFSQMSPTRTMVCDQLRQCNHTSQSSHTQFINTCSK